MMILQNPPNIPEELENDDAQRNNNDHSKKLSVFYSKIIIMYV